MDTIRRARRLRQDMPVSERRLWDLLRDRQVAGLKFRRQVPIGPYVADGPFHDPTADAVRDGWLRAQGFRVLRFSNSELMNKDRVLGQILEAVEAPPAFDF